MTRLHKQLLIGLTTLLLIPAAQAWEGETLKVCADPNNPPYSDQKKQGFENKIADGAKPKDTFENLIAQWYREKGMIRYWIGDTRIKEEAKPWHQKNLFQTQVVKRR